MVDGLDRYDSTKLERAVLRVMGLSVTGKERGRIEFKAFIDLADANESTPTDEPRFLGETSKRWREEEDGKVSVFFDVTLQAGAFVDNRHENTLTILSGGEELSWERLDLAFYVSA